MRKVTEDMFTQSEKEQYMHEALVEAKKAEAIGEVPIGAVIVHEGKIIGRGYNQRETSQYATAHAEMLAINQANETLGHWRLEKCQMFVTLEPCAMCSGAIVLARMPEVYYGARDAKSGMAGSLIDLLNFEPLNHKSQVEYGILEEECSQILKDFFKKLRTKRKQEKG